MPKEVKLMAEYGGTVVWFASGDINTPFDVEALPVSHELKAAICKWATAYDNTLNDVDPTASGFKSEADALAFEAEGIRLWKQLKRELGADYNVRYFSEKESRLLE